MNNQTFGFTKEDPWRIFRIMAEFVDSFETLSQVGPAVTIFGSARAARSDPWYKAAVELGRLGPDVAADACAELLTRFFAERR